MPQTLSSRNVEEKEVLLIYGSELYSGKSINNQLKKFLNENAFRSEKFFNKFETNPEYLVKTKHSSVADRIVNCCDSADCDFCIARCRSF